MAKPPKKRSKHSARDIAEEIVRRAIVGEPGRERLPYVLHLSDPPTQHQRLQLAAVRLMRHPVAIMPVPCATVQEWVERYGKPRGG